MTRFEEVSTFYDTSCGKGPIRATDVLVLYWSHCTSLHPVDWLNRTLSRIEALSTELSLVDMVAHEEISLG